ncbi:unnamed protein product [Leptidea sinapis]|uniref:Uncharacterized protein n=1 Tax=Leptidea sinapis TaxID=189913 RepID=A0A5E4QTC9_9NEOP|nr:unnamed protein product [Leptidea sinapis]
MEKSQNKNNKTNNQQQSNMIQQTFHKSMFERTRSNSLGALPKDIQKPVENQTDLRKPDNINLEEWQKDKIPAWRRKRKETSPIQNEANKKIKNTSNYQISTHNSFEILKEELTKEKQTDSKEYIPKPEPIFVTGVLNITSLKEKLTEICETNLFTMTTL